MKCRKCGAEITAEHKRCPKCDAPVLLRVMEQEEKRHLSSKEIREKEKRMKLEYEKLKQEKQKETEKAEKLAEKERLIKEKELAKEKEQQEKEATRQKAIAEKEALEKEKANKIAEEKAEKDAARKQKAEEKALKQEEKQKQKAEKKAEPKPPKADTEENKSSGKTFIILAVIAVIAAIGYFISNGVLTGTEDVNGPTPSSEPAPVVVEEVTPEPTPVPTPEPTPVPTPEPTPEPTAEPTPVPTPVPTPTPKPRVITGNKILFPSDSQYITEADVTGLSRYEVALIRNEIFARKGYTFDNKAYSDYFYSQEWYNPGQATNKSLNEYEKYNVEFLKNYEVSQGWR